MTLNTKEAACWNLTVESLNSTLIFEMMDSRSISIAFNALSSSVSDLIRYSYPPDSWRTRMSCRFQNKYIGFGCHRIHFHYATLSKLQILELSMIWVKCIWVKQILLLNSAGFEPTTFGTCNQFKTFISNDYNIDLRSIANDNISNEQYLYSKNIENTQYMKFPQNLTFNHKMHFLITDNYNG